MMNPNQKLEDQLNRVHRELVILYEISAAMRTTLELNHILYIILTGVTAHSGLGFNRAILFLANKEERQLECKMAIGPESGERAQEIWRYFEHKNPRLEDLISGEKVQEITQQSPLYHSLKDARIPLGINETSVLAEAYHQGEVLHIKPEEIHRYQKDPLLNIFQTQELVVVPLKAQDEVKGLIIADNLYTQRPITDDDIRIFMMLANQAGLAIENSLLYEMVVHKSHTDSLTNLWNHGFFQETLSSEMEKAKTTGTPLSLAIMDIDNFKKLNDDLGHQTGDVILRELARIFKNSSREMDYVCRYGGEEFAIIFTETDQEKSFTIAERMRGKVEHHNFSTINSSQPTNITVSIGLASFPKDAQRKEDLITKADQAMYIAKFSGKNRTCCAGASNS